MPKYMGSNIFESRSGTCVIECDSNRTFGCMCFTITVWEEISLVFMRLPEVSEGM